MTQRIPSPLGPLAPSQAKNTATRTLGYPGLSRAHAAPCPQSPSAVRPVPPRRPSPADARPRHKDHAPGRTPASDNQAARPNPDAAARRQRPCPSRTGESVRVEAGKLARTEPQIFGRESVDSASGRESVDGASGAASPDGDWAGARVRALGPGLTSDSADAASCCPARRSVGRAPGFRHPPALPV